MERSNGIKIFIAGDFCVYHPERVSLGHELKKIINFSDVRVVNFEGPLQVGEKHTAGEFYLRQSHLSPEWLLNNGFNVIGLANNHAFDFGEEGLKATKKAFEDVLAIGCGKWSEAYGVKYLKVKNKTIGFFSASSADLATLKDRWTDDGKYGCAWINHISVSSIISEAKGTCDYLIVLPHAGVEYMAVPLPEWRDIYKSLIDAGADAVMASHPHVPQGFEMYAGKPIFYSLGNFAFEKDDRCASLHWYNSVAVLIEITENDVQVQPILTYLNEDHIVEVDARVESVRHFRHLCNILTDDSDYMEEVNRFVLSLYPKYENWLLSGYGAVGMYPKSLRQMYRIFAGFLKLKVNRRLFLHQLREESTRWLMIRANKLLSKTKL